MERDGKMEKSIISEGKTTNEAIEKGLKIQIPKNYYPDNKIEKKPIFSWRENGDKLYSNWVNYYLS